MYTRKRVWRSLELGHTRPAVCACYVACPEHAIVVSPPTYVSAVLGHQPASQGMLYIERNPCPSSNLDKPTTTGDACGGPLYRRLVPPVPRKVCRGHVPAPELQVLSSVHAGRRPRPAGTRPESAPDRVSSTLPLPLTRATSAPSNCCACRARKPRCIDTLCCTDSSSSLRADSRRS